MKNVYRMQTAWEGPDLGRAVGETCRAAAPCRPEVHQCAGQEGKVIDLAAWKAESLVEPEKPGAPESGLGLYEGRVLVRRPRMRWDARAKCEAAATLSAAGVMVAMLLRVLVF